MHWATSLHMKLWRWIAMCMTLCPLRCSLYWGTGNNFATDNIVNIAGKAPPVVGSTQPGLVDTFAGMRSTLRGLKSNKR